MTDQSKIQLPDDGDGKSESSLFERASGVFGLNPFRTAPMPEELAEPPMKRARPAKQTEAAEQVSADVKPTTRPVGEPDKQVPAHVSPPSVAVEAPVKAVSFSGQKYPIDRMRLKEQGMIVPDGKVSALLEEFRIVKRQLIAAADQVGSARSRRVLVCSPLPGEGKTFTSVNLAIAMASERDGEVLLVDADFAKPSVLSTLGLPDGPGLLDALSDPTLKVEDLVVGTDIPGLWVLPAGKQTDADSEWLASAHTADLLDRLTAGAPHRMVIFDSPPALAASPAADLAKHVGQALLVARADQTGRNALEDAIQLLGGCPDIKLLLNAATFSPSGRRFGSYYGHEG